MSNALKAISSTPDELRVGNYIVLFGGRDLEGLLTRRINADGTRGEFFTAETQLESGYTKAGRFVMDWEHGRDPSPDAPGKANDGVIGYVDWSTAKADDTGVWVERALYLHREYMKYLKALIDAGLVGTSSRAVAKSVIKTDNGRIDVWPLERDTLTIIPTDWRNKSENVVSALKALNIALPETSPETGDKQPEPEAEPEAGHTAATAAKANVSAFLSRIEQEL